MSHAKTNLGLQNPPSTGKGSRKQPLTNLESRIRRAYSDYCEAESAKLQIKRLWKLISLCHNNQRAQKELLKVLNLPQTAGPISLNPIPANLFEHNQKLGEDSQALTQLQFLFDFLKNIQEGYFCWVIYFSEELRVLNLKLLRHDELSQFQELFNPNLNLIGVFCTVQERTAKMPVQETQAQKLYNQEAQKPYNYENNACKKHAKSTPNDSTGSSWKQQQQTSHDFAKTVKSNKFRSISRKLKYEVVASIKKMNDEKARTISKSLSLIGRFSKSKSTLQSAVLAIDKHTLCSTHCNLPKPSLLKVERNLNARGKLKKESKVHRFERVKQSDN